MASKYTAVIELTIKQFRSHTLGLGTVHLERLLVGMQIGALPPIFAEEGFVDTGAFLSIFPEQCWRQFLHEIHWPTTQDEAALPKWCTTVRGLGGGKCPCRLGRVAVELYSSKRPKKRIGPGDLFALFAFDKGTMRYPLLGLNGGSFDGRRLIIAKNRGRAYLCEVRP
jgi:hypothetical protein